MPLNEGLQLPDDGEEMVEITIDRRGEVIPNKHDKKIIIDADTIAYSACSVCENKVEPLGEEFMTEAELAELRAMPDWDEEEWCYRSIDIDEATSHAVGKIDLILENIGGKSENVELHFTGGKVSFRYELLREAFPKNTDMHYKAKRKNKKAPLGLAEVKAKLLELYPGDIHEAYEADDIVVKRKKDLGDEAILCYVDKDVGKNVPGRHWNYYDSQKHNISMGWEEFTEEDALFHQYLQVITGDKSDNVPGLKGIGEKKALKYIVPGMDADELWEGVLLAYNNHCNYGDPEEMAILNMRLVNMHQLNDDMEIKLWNPPS